MLLIFWEQQLTWILDLSLVQLCHVLSGLANKILSQWVANDSKQFMCLFGLAGSTQIKPGFNVMIVLSGGNFQIALVRKSSLKIGSATWTLTRSSGVFVYAHDFLWLCVYIYVKSLFAFLRSCTVEEEPEESNEEQPGYQKTYKQQCVTNPVKCNKYFF